MRDLFDDEDLPDVVSAVTEWIDDVEGLLGQAQTAMESLRFHPGVAPDAQRTMYQLLVLLRQRRADAPRPDAVRTWLRALAFDAGVSHLRGPARFLNLAQTSPTSPTGA